MGASGIMKDLLLPIPLIAAVLLALFPSLRRRLKRALRRIGWAVFGWIVP